MDRTEWTTALFASVDAKNTPRFLTFLSDDAAFRYANAPASVGKAAIGAAVDAFFAMIRASKHDILNAWAHPDHVIVQGNVTYTRHDGRALTLPFANILGTRGGLIHDYRIYIDATPLFV